MGNLKHNWGQLHVLDPEGLKGPTCSGGRHLACPLAQRWAVLCGLCCQCCRCAHCRFSFSGWELIWLTDSEKKRGMLGATLPGFRSCNPSWLRLSERPWDHKSLRRQSLSSLAWAPPLPPLLHPAWPWAWPVSQWWVRFLKGGTT